MPTSSSPVPRLLTAQTGPLLQLEASLLGKAAEIEAWFRTQWQKNAPPFYSSVDLRNAGFKLAPVDTNLFPGGFNNLNPAFEPLCVQALQMAMQRVCPSACDVLLVPENHTRNKFYLENVATLAALIQKAGYRLRIGSLIPDLHEPLELTLEISGRKLLLEPLRRTADRVHVGDFYPCTVLLNNDLSAGVPEILKNIRQDVVPPPDLGWHLRQKSNHFGFYREVAREFGAVAGLDPWLVDPLFRNCGQINFLKREGQECLEANVELLLADIGAKYAEYGIQQEPFVIIKSEAGTYGMGVMTAKSVEDVRNMNRKSRTHMASAKEGREVTGAIIQEGVYTFEKMGEDGATAEPVVYMIDRNVVGGFYRLNSQRGNQENLNAPGMRFEPLAFEEACSSPDHSCGPDERPNRFYAYGVVARLAALAAAREIAAVSEIRAQTAAA
ncbi:glutamate--cysteine ligase [Solimonas aquatica]|uniref:Glutamate--cysteine ligase n=1 Tax=Solimonas aquatica TaxID=489703 RepID=A0A1H9IKB6_9GAMM|nr:glutamate--cysteine ligase [Solimonas aquatica]SEQ75043.1 glutamate--cysteine ligase [Solimonas aquatica]